MESILPSAIWVLLLEFRSAFSAPTFENFVRLSVGWILCTKNHTITQVIRHSRGIVPEKHYSVFYRFLSRAEWTGDRIGMTLLSLVTRALPGLTVYILVDDTLCSKSGPHVWGTGMHHDARRSTYKRNVHGKKTTIFTHGHCWVLVSVWLPLPWNPERGLAIPVRWRLYRQKKRCPEEEYQKRTELARDMLNQVLSELPPHYRVFIAGDREYSCRTVVPSVQERATFVGPMPMNAAFYELPGEQRGRGRPRKKGKRVPTPEALAADDSIPWETRTTCLYGRQVRFLTKSQVGLWYRVAGEKPGRMVVTRDPKGHCRDGAYFCTDSRLCLGDVVATFARRWAQEVMHRDLKQHLGLECPQNGWWRRAKGEEPRVKQPGSQPHRAKGSRAVKRTPAVPFVSYAIVVLHYLKVGSPEATIANVLKVAPWYRHKRTISFADMLEAARSSIWASRLSANPHDQADVSKTAAALPDWLLAVA